QQDDERFRQAQQQQLERLRYQAQLAERQFSKVDPDNRLVSAELERRWEVALRELKEAEEKAQHQQQQSCRAEPVSAQEREAFLWAGKTTPQLWQQGRRSQQQKKPFLRCLIDKVVAHRPAPDTLQVRIVWRGGETTTKTLTVRVGSLARRSGAEKMEK